MRPDTQCRTRTTPLRSARNFALASTTCSLTPNCSVRVLWTVSASFSLRLISTGRSDNLRSLAVATHCQQAPHESDPQLPVASKWQQCWSQHHLGRMSHMVPPVALRFLPLTAPTTCAFSPTKARIREISLSTNSTMVQVCRASQMSTAKALSTSLPLGVWVTSGWN